MMRVPGVSQVTGRDAAISSNTARESQCLRSSVGGCVAAGGALGWLVKTSDFSIGQSHSNRPASLELACNVLAKDPGNQIHRGLKSAHDDTQNSGGRKQSFPSRPHCAAAPFTTMPSFSVAPADVGIATVNKVWLASFAMLPDSPAVSIAITAG